MGEGGGGGGGGGVLNESLFRVKANAVNGDSSARDCATSETEKCVSVRARGGGVGICVHKDSSARDLAKPEEVDFCVEYGNNEVIR